MSAIHLLLPSQRQSVSPSPSPILQHSCDLSTARTLPPLNFGSPGLLDPTSPSGFLNATFGDSPNPFPAPGHGANFETIPGSSSRGPTQAAPTFGQLPHLSSPTITTDVLPLLPSALQKSQSPQPLQPSISSPQTQSQPRPGTGSPGKGLFLNSHTGLLTTPHLPPTSNNPGNNGKHKEKDKEVTHAPQPANSGHSKRNHPKLNLLNPMALLMRRRGYQGGNLNENSRRAGARDLPEDFDPGIIYATRHPDWSSPGPKRPPVDVVNRLGVSVKSHAPALSGTVSRVEGEDFVDRQRTPLFKECFEDETTPRRPVPGPPNGGKPRVARPPLQQQNPVPLNIKTSQALTLASPSVSLGTTQVERSPPVDLPLVPAPTDNTAVLSPSQSSASSSSSCSRCSSGGEYSSIRRKGVTLVDHPLTLPRHLSSSRFSFEVSSTADSSHGEYSPGVDDEDACMALAKDGTPSPTKHEGIGLGLGVGLGMGRDYKRQYPTRAAPRWGDDDTDDDVVDLASYENDDDLYYDDGIILGDDYGSGQGFVTDKAQTHEMESASLAWGSLPTQIFPDAMGRRGNLSVETAELEETFTGAQSKDGPTAFPPFVNPVGSGLDYQKQLEYFYSPNLPRMNMNGLPLALGTLNQSLCRIQQQQLLQQQDFDELDSPAPGFGIDIDPGYILEPEGAMNFDDDLDMDDPMVAAANAEALEHDTEGEYGQEFGFYSAINAENVGAEQLFAGGYFGEPGANPLRSFLVRRPSLTPISERSECSYRNSMVFGFDTNPPGSRGGGGPGIHPLALSQNFSAPTLDTAGEGQGVGEDVTLSHLLKLRKSWAGGSQNGSIKSVPGSPSGTDTGNLGGQSPVISSSSSPVVGPGLGQLGISPGGLGLTPRGYGLYGVPEWDIPPVGMLSVGGLNLTGVNLGVGIPMGLPLVSGMGVLAPGTLSVGPGNLHILNPGAQTEQVNNNNAGNIPSPGLNPGIGSVHRAQLYTALLNNCHPEVPLHPVHLHQSMLEEPGEMITKSQHLHELSPKPFEQHDSQLQTSGNEENELEIDDGENGSVPIHLPDITTTPWINTESTLTRGPSAEDSSYASAYGSPRSEQSRCGGRVRQGD